MITKEEAINRWEIQNAFEQNNAPLQFRKINTDECWSPATWSKWEWDRYEYRIAPMKTEELVPLVCFLNSLGEVVWISQTQVSHVVGRGWKPIKRFITIDKVRHAVV